MTQAVAAPSRPKTLLDKLAYGFGSVAYGVKDNGFSFLLLLYYNQVIGVPALIVSTALSVVLVIDAIVDPLIGYASDNTHSRWGRRHPWMYAAALPIALAWLALWMPPENLPDSAMFVYLVVVASSVRVLISFYEIPATSLVTDLTRDYDERTSFLSFRYFFGWYGGLTIFILALYVLLTPTPEQPIGQLNQEGYYRYAILGSVMMFVAILVTAAGTHRHIPTFAPAPPKQPFNIRRIFGEVFQALSHRPFLIMIGVAVFHYASAGLTAAMVTYVRTYFWGLTAAQIATVSLANFGSALVALVLAPWIGKRLGKKRAAVWLNLIGIVWFPVIYILRFAGLLPPDGSDGLVAALFGASLISVILSVTGSILTASMIADLIEDSQLRTGRRDDGMFFSANSFAAQCASGLGLFLSGVILTVVNFPEGARPGQVSNDVLVRLMVAEIGVVAVLQIISLGFLMLYPITRQRHAENLRVLAERAAAAEEPAHMPASGVGATAT